MSNELTLDDSQPVELYEFSSIHETHYFTSDVVSWNVDGNTYLPVAGLSRTNIIIGTHKANKNELKIEMPTEEQIAYDWAFDTHPPELEILIKRLDRAVGTTYMIWKGRVGTITVKGLLAIFTCPTRFISILDSRIPTVHVQPQCNHVLFDDLCGLDRATYTHTAIVTLISNDWIYIDITLPASNPGLGAHNDFLNGEALNVTTTETRTITKVGAGNNAIKVNYDFSDLSVGDTLEISQGCDHMQESDYGCSRYSNLSNFGGFPFIPGEDRNIFQVGIF